MKKNLENTTDKDWQSPIPAINLPKGGGAIRGIGEQFQVNSLTGTSSFNVPVYASPGRSGFIPQLSLSYDSGNGNGPFGYGWNINFPAISRKTSKGIPKYNDAEDSDTFLLSGAEDLVPHLEENGNGEWVRVQYDQNGYRVYRYRPRIEGLFSRIEKWVDHATGESFWKTVSKENITSIYGASRNTRVYDPHDENRIFQWMIEQSSDAKGNIIRYSYKRENTDQIDPAHTYEHSRLTHGESFNHLYLKAIHYGNKTAGAKEAFHFNMVFDYGDHDSDQPTAEEQQPWDIRKDPFSSFVSGFEIRQYRLCQRILMFHEFDELGETPVLVRSTRLSYEQSEKSSLLTEIVQTGHKIASDGSASQKSLPPLVFSYSRAVVGSSIETIDKENLAGLPSGVDGTRYQWLDLDGEGLPGIFAENGGGWYYKNNRGNGTFTALQSLATKPHPSAAGTTPPVITDIDSDGAKELVLVDSPLKGYFEQDDEAWLPFHVFDHFPNIDTSDPNLRYIDLNGDGLADILISEDETYTWYPSEGNKGYAAPEYVRKTLEEEKGPNLVFSDPEQSIYLADMTGDGLNDILRIRNGEIVYWPNRGYGSFGGGIVMDNAPVLDTPDHFDQKRIRLFDVDGTGTTDLIYYDGDTVRIWYNCSGNCWSEAEEITLFPLVDNLTTLSVIDLLGKGTGCLVWSSPLPGNESRQISYIDLMSEGKPYLMTSVNNNMGKEMLFSYTSSTDFYLEDLLNGTPWITKLHFPVHVLKQATVIDHISSSRLVTCYKYHHGYYDGEEREFRGFGMVEQTDSESFDTYNANDALDMPPVYTKSWFHTGAYVKQGVISQQYAVEYYAGDPIAHDFPDSVIENMDQLDYDQLREAYRSLKGKMLRQEIYALDGTALEDTPYSVIETNYRVQLLQPRGGENYGVWLALENESLTYAYERNNDDPGITHSILLETDAFGQPLKTVDIAYPRRSSIHEAYPEQQRQYVSVQTNNYFNETEDFYLLGVALEQKGYEIEGLSLSPDTCFRLNDLTGQLEHVFDDEFVLPHHEPFSGGVQARLLSWTKNYFWNDETTVLPFGEVSALALPSHSEQIVMSTDWVSEVYDTRVTDAMMEAAGYVNRDGYWWNPGTTVHFLDEASFYLPFKTVDVFGNQNRVYYDEYAMAALQSEDAVGNIVAATIDYRTLTPKRITDINDNTSEALTDALGMTIATSMYGTVDGAEKGDTPLEHYEEQNGFTIGDVIADPDRYLQGATGFFYYNPDAWLNDHQPPHFVNLLRETHVSELDGEETPIQIHLGYSDGFGRTLQQKVKTDDDDAGNERWLVTGRTVFNNKEKPVKQYEPFFSDTFAYEDEEEVAPVGVSPVIYYDPLGRVIKTETPKGFYSEVVFDPWQVGSYDENDTVKDSAYYRDHSESGDEEAEALQKAEAHYNTPSVVKLDSLAREFMGLQYREEGGDPLMTHTTFDIQGNPITITDPRQYIANQSRSVSDLVHNFEHRYDLAGNVLYSQSTDAGESWILINALGNPVHAWNGRSFHTQTTYDSLQRPAEIKADGNGLDQVVQRLEYGENEPGAFDKNLRGQLVRHYDEAGLIENTLFDFKSQVLTSSRTLRAEYKTEVNWNDVGSVGMEDERFTSEIEYDALGRVVLSTNPDGSVSKPAYHQAGWLKKVDVQLNGESDYTAFVESIDYNAKGQRTKIVYGNGVHTRYDYEATTFRLINLNTTRQETDGSLTVLQDIRYLYDPVGNIVRITDKSHENVFTSNQEINAESDFIYDALYQLMEANGREHMGLSKTDYQQHSDIFKNIHFAHVNDPYQLRNYTRQYTYDDAGNLTQIRHIGEHSFTRDMAVSDISNRAITDEMDNTADVESYFDAAGNIQQLEHLEGITWNYRNNIASVTVIERDSENDSEYYVYDASGQRVRKVKETYSSSGDLLRKEEKIYLGGVEWKRKYAGSNETLQEDRSALHVTDDQKRIAIVYYWTNSSDSSVTTGENRTHYQLGNHLGSAAMELDANGRLISYEEYFPFGGTAFTTGSNAAEVALKEYRYTGKERDDTTGLYYYGARYYAPWIGRWLNPDPAGTVDGLNVYRYVRNNPLKLVDLNGTYPGKFQKKFNKEIVELIITSGNQKVIDRLLVPNKDGGFKLNTSYRVGFNAGHAVSGDRISDLQELSIELAITNQRDGTMERQNPGMSKASVEVDIGNGIKIPIERYTASELSAILPPGIDDLPNTTGWTRAELDEQLDAVRSGRPAPPTGARARWVPISNDLPKASGLRGLANSASKFIPTKYDDLIIGVIIGVGVGIYELDIKEGAYAGGSMIIPETLNSNTHSAPLRLGRDAASFHPVVAAGEMALALNDFLIWMSTPTVDILKEIRVLEMKENDPDKYEDLENGLLEWNGENWIYKQHGERP